MKRRFLISMLIVGLTACGGGGTSNGEDRLLNKNSVEHETNEQYLFYTKIAPGSLTQLDSVHISTGADRVHPYHYFQISNTNQLQYFNRVFPEAQLFKASDLSSYVYFVMPAAGCTSSSEFVGADFGEDQLTFNIRRVGTLDDKQCTSESTASLYVFKAVKTHAPEIVFNQVYFSPSSFLPVRNHVIKDQNEWAALWAENNKHWSPPPPLPELDFINNTYVSVRDGGGSNGCYGSSIDRVYESNGKTIVEYTTTSPDGSALCAAVMTSFWHVIAIPKTTNEVQFVMTHRSS